MRQLLIVMTLLALSAGAALADDSDSAREHFVKGTRAYELGLYDEAIAEYMAAYKIKDDPAFLFNLGQAHRLAKHPAEALRFYKTYLAKLPKAPNRAEVEAKIADMNRLVEEQKQAVAQPVPNETAAEPSQARPPAEASRADVPPTEASHPETPTAAAPATEPVALAGPTPAAQPRPGRGLRISGIASAAGGLALVGLGVAFGVRAKQAGDDLTQLDAQNGVFDPSKETAGKRDQGLAVVCLGVGAAALVTGAVLYLLGARHEVESPRALVISPSVAAHSAGATLRMVF
jgi:tetratricopeptide (TPR) repeat protein